jgi:hypothetical protein
MKAALPDNEAERFEQVKADTAGGVPTREELKAQERDAIIKALKRTNGKVFRPEGAAELVSMKPSLSHRVSLRSTLIAEP